MRIILNQLQIRQANIFKRKEKLNINKNNNSNNNIVNNINNIINNQIITIDTKIIKGKIFITNNVNMKAKINKK